MMIYHRKCIILKSQICYNENLEQTKLVRGNFISSRIQGQVKQPNCRKDMDMDPTGVKELNLPDIFISESLISVLFFLTADQLLPRSV